MCNKYCLLIYLHVKCFEVTRIGNTKLGSLRRDFNKARLFVIVGLR